MEALSRRLVGGWTELHVAAAAGDLARVRLVVQRSPADVDRVTKDGRTSLHLAAAAGFDAVVGELLDRHARTCLQDESGATPLHVAAVAGHSRCVAALLGPRNREGPAERQRLLAARDRSGRDALLAAVEAGQAGALQELLRAGADAAGARDAKSGCGVMLVAVRLGHTHLLPLLAAALGHGPAGLEQRDPATGATPLHVAAAAGAMGPLAWLLAAGASTATRDNAGRTPGEAALAAGQAAAARAIREATLAAAGVGSPATGGSGGGVLSGGRAGGGSAGGAVGGAGYGYGYGRYDHNLLAPASPAAASSGGGAAGPGVGLGSGYAAPPRQQATPWRYGDDTQEPGVTAAGEGGAAAAAGGVGSVGGRLQVPETAPPPVYYPTPPPGAGVYY